MRSGDCSEIFSDLGETLDRLKEILDAPLDEHRFIMDGTIRRFRFCIELFWKIFSNFVIFSLKFSNFCNFTLNLPKFYDCYFLFF